MATVKENYKKKQKEIKLMLKNIEKALNSHEKKFKKHETNWGYVGDLGMVSDTLSTLNYFSKNNK